MKEGDIIKMKYRGQKHVFQVLGGDEKITQYCIQRMMFHFGEKITYQDSIQKFSEMYDRYNGTNDSKYIGENFYPTSLWNEEENDTPNDGHQHRMYLKLIR